MDNMTTQIKLYHIIHVDRLPSILKEQYLFSDFLMRGRLNTGTVIGMDAIKHRRLSNNLKSCQNLTVGQCVPFYFCPRSVMLYVLYRHNADGLSYHGGQEPIIHLVFDLAAVLKWTKMQQLQACYTTSNAGAMLFSDYNDFTKIHDMLNWSAIEARVWNGSGICPQTKIDKQAECLIQERVPASLIETIGVYNSKIECQVQSALQQKKMSVSVQIKPDWYY